MASGFTKIPLMKCFMMAASIMEDVNKIDLVEKSRLKEEKQKFAIKAGIFLGGVTVVSALAGFGTTLASVKRNEKRMLSAAGFTESQIAEALAHEAGTRLALRALGWGTVLAVTGVSAICFTAWKISGANNFEEFRQSVGNVLPRIPKSQNPGRSEFDSFQDFIDYISKPTNR